MKNFLKCLSFLPILLITNPITEKTIHTLNNETNTQTTNDTKNYWKEIPLTETKTIYIDSDNTAYFQDRLLSEDKKFNLGVSITDVHSIAFLNDGWLLENKINDKSYFFTYSINNNNISIRVPELKKALIYEINNNTIENIILEPFEKVTVYYSNGNKKSLVLEQGKAKLDNGDIFYKDTNSDDGYIITTNGSTTIKTKIKDGMVALEYKYVENNHWKKGQISKRFNHDEYFCIRL